MKPGKAIAKTKADANNTRTSEHKVLRLLLLLKLFKQAIPKTSSVISSKSKWKIKL